MAQNSKTNNPPEEPAKQQTTGQPKPAGSKVWPWTLVCGCCGCLAIVVVGILIFLGLAFLGSKGQPGTIVKPTDVKTPKDLKAAGIDKAINLNWGKSSNSNVAKYNVYKSKTSGSNFEKINTVESTTNLVYADANVQKGQTYYYTVTAVTTDGIESGNSNQASYALTPAALLPNGVQNWQDVLTKFDADQKYSELLTKITGLTRPDIEKLISSETKGKNLKKKLSKGTIITNTTENYKILPNYTLNEDKWFLTDEKGTPLVMVWCGNPIKLIQEMTTLAKFVQTTQNITYNIIYILPAPITNIIIYASEPINDGLDAITPDDLFGPGFSEPEHPQDNPNLNDGTTDSNLEEGEQWAVHGELLVKADPVDPAAYQSVTMTITLTSGEPNVNITYHVTGTDGYTDSGTKPTNNEGKIDFHIPGGADGIVDTITVDVPDKGLNGSTSYTF